MQQQELMTRSDDATGMLKMSSDEERCKDELLQMKMKTKMKKGPTTTTKQMEGA